MIKKKSYFNSTELEIDDPYDLDKWNYIAKIITYDSQRLGDIKALDYHSFVNFEDEKELEKFRMWYKTKKKASGDTMDKITKKAREQYGINSTNIYGTNTGSSFDSDDYSVSMADQMRRSNEYEKRYGQIPQRETPEDIASKRKTELSNRMSKYLTLMQKNLLSSEDIDLDTFNKALEAIKELTIITKRIKTAEMGIDLMYRTSSQLNRYGLKKHASGLRKFAQQQEEELQAAPPPVEAAPDSNQVQVQNSETLQQETQQAPLSEGDQMGQALESTQDAQPVPLSEIQTPGPSEGEYDKIIDEDIGMSDAAGKLEDVAGMLADRRVIRYLAEFDIMLDKLGIASMFPELAESQSKLIDAYSYALTRVSKMMGQLTSAAEILEGIKKVPGATGAKNNTDTE